jgi:hypothetical protein
MRCRVAQGRVRLDRLCIQSQAQGVFMKVVLYKPQTWIAKPLESRVQPVAVGGQLRRVALGGELRSVALGGACRERRLG